MTNLPTEPTITQKPGSTELWRIELFGGLRLRQWDRTLTRFETRKAGALLAFLAFHRHRAHGRDVLAEWLWPDEDPEATRSRLRQALSALRRALEAPPIVPGSIFLADRTQVRLNPDAVTTDVAEFEAALQEAQTAAPTERVRLLTGAVELYGGELLAGFDEAWIPAERERLHEAYVGALTQLAGALAESGDRQGAAEYARRAVKADPMREEAHCLLMRLYAAAGRTPDALRQYRELEKALREELDAVPSAEAQSLLARLRAASTASASAPPSSEAPPEAEPIPAGTAAGSAEPHARQRPKPRRALIAVPVLLVILTSLFLWLWPGNTVSPGSFTSGALSAQTLYRRGRDAWNERSEAGLRTAQDRFEKAIDRDPGSAPAYAGLADTYSLLAYYGYMDPSEAYEKATAAAEKALERDPDSVEARTSLAWIKMTFAWDWDGAEELFLQATAQDPPYATAHQWYSFFLMALGRTQASLAQIRRAQDLEPHPSVISKSVGQRSFHARHYDEAVAAYQAALRADPNSSLTRYWLGLAYEQQALAHRDPGPAGTAFQASLRELHKAYDLSNGDPAVRAALGHVYAVSGRREEARTQREALEALQQTRYVSPVAMAILYTGLGDKGRALDFLEKAKQERSPELTLLKVEPRFDPLREEPRFRRLVKAVFGQ